MTMQGEGVWMGCDSRGCTATIHGLECRVCFLDAAETLQWNWSVVGHTDGRAETPAEACSSAEKAAAKIAAAGDSREPRRSPRDEAGWWDVLADVAIEDTQINPPVMIDAASVAMIVRDAVELAGRGRDTRGALTVDLWPEQRLVTEANDLHALVKHAARNKR